MKKQELIKWLSEVLLMDVTEETIFLKDIGIAELEVDIFFMEFINEFNIDASLLNVNDYTLEDTSFVEVWLRNKRAKSFDVDHLLKVIQLKKWYDPEVIDNHLI